MKKLFMLASAALLVTGVTFADNGKKKKCAKGKSCCSKSEKKSCSKGKKSCHKDKAETTVSM
ncbi:MAG: hypothetical protein WAT19_00940 [Ferruginibacter sp.]